jgi:outer membrane protein assembly factor BamD (BamD/ComL family)
MVQAYTELGLLDNANNAQRVLDANFGAAAAANSSATPTPDEASEALVKRTWFSRLTFGLFDD